MEPNINEIISATMTDLIKASFSRVMEGSSNAIKATWQRAFEEFSDYMAECYTKNRFVRILCHGESDVDLKDIYVGSSFTAGNKSYKDHEVAFRVNEGENLVICGNGGAGKTFFMRKLWLDLLESSVKTPIFVELRKLNSLSNIDLISFLRISISSRGKLSDSVFDGFCSSGRFIFILDGFDEVMEDRHIGLQAEIAKITDLYPKCPVVVSSRFDGRFAGWQKFRVLEAAPFSLAQTKALCIKIPFDEKFKKLFLKKMTAQFFDENSMFLSNPLLAVMMMMTFKSNMDIPKKMGIFYEQAFNTLFQYHDSTKAFKREKLLDIHQFRNAFGCFALLSYYAQMYEFTKSEVIEKIEQSNKLNGYSFSSDKVLFDFEMGVNLLRQDGLRYVFIHRSFQEYFAADALVRILPKRFAEICPFLERRHGDNVLKFCLELNRNLVVSDYIQPRLLEMEGNLFRKEVDDKLVFRALELLQAKLTFTIVSQASKVSKKKPSRSSNAGSTVSDYSVGSAMLDYRDQRHLFLNAIERLINAELKFGGFGADCFFSQPGSIFRAASDFVVAEDDLKKFGAFNITFQNDLPVVTPLNFGSGKEEVGEPISLPVKSALFRMLILSSIAFEKSVREVAEWCASEANQYSEKDKSLSEVFGLS